MPAYDFHQLVARIAMDAADGELDDASFRRRTQRAVRQAQRAIGQPAASGAARKTGTTTRQRRTAGTQRSAYRFIAVPNGAGGTTSVSMSKAIFAELSTALGGDTQVSALARKAALGHKPDSGISRSAYVVKRLQQRAARASR